MEKKIDIEDMFSKARAAAINTSKKFDISEFDTEAVLRQVMKLPVVKVNGGKYLKKELVRFYPQETVALAIAKNPAYAGISREQINLIAKQAIDYETNKVSAISFAAGIPGGIAMAATIPADITQYFTFILRIMQKLAYLYGFDEFEFSEDEINDDTLNQIMIFLGVMFGVQGANAGVKVVAEAATKKVSRSLAQKALTKGTVYPIVKKIAQAVGIRMTKQVFAEGVSKVVPVVGGFVAGGLTYATFKPCSVKLKTTFQELNLSNPEFYEKDRENDIIDMESYENIDEDTAEPEWNDFAAGDDQVSAERD